VQALLGDGAYALRASRANVQLTTAYSH
jgi:hypothetical protein